MSPFLAQGVFYQAKSGMLKKQYSPGCVINMVTLDHVQRGLVVYVVGALWGKESKSTSGRITESFIKECKRASLGIVNYSTQLAPTF